MEKLPDASGIWVAPSMSFDAFRGEIVLSDNRRVTVTLDGLSLKDEKLASRIFEKIRLRERNITKIEIKGDKALFQEKNISLSEDISDILTELNGKREKIKLIHDKVETLASDFGYKGANLHVLEEIAAKLRSLGYKVYVPKFLLISHSQNQVHLEKYYPSFSYDLEKFIQIQKGMDQLTDNGLELLQNMQVKIRLAFKNYTFEGLELSTFREDRRLMVRSSGREDTKEASMAGAHTSIAGVQREEKQISEAIGAVIASYLSETSILHKFVAGFNISGSFFAPVILQEMVGEEINETKPHAELLRCGICYTKEIGAETPDLTVIESAYGHNELVVNGENCDTYFVYSDGVSHQILEPKPTRLVANIAQNGESKFVRKQNPHEIIKAGSLSAEALNLIKAASSEIHYTYGQIMDIEWIYDPKEQALWVVQARPVVKKIEFDPSMIDKSILKNPERGEAIVHQGGKAVALTKREQIICAHTLGNACNRYLKLGGKDNPVRAVIITEPAGRLSHPACVLRERGVTVMHCPHFDVHSMDRKGILTLIDTQQGIIGQITDSDLSSLSEEEVYKRLRQSSIIIDGWFKHPIPAQESLQNYLLDEGSIRDLLSKLCEGHTFYPGSISELIASICSENMDESNRAVKNLTVTLLKYLKRLSKSSTLLEKHLFKEGILLLRNILVLGNQLLVRSCRLQRLHTAKRIEALCYQEGSSRVLNSISVRTLLSIQMLTKSARHINIEVSSDTKAGIKLLESMTLSTLQKVGTTETVLHTLKEPLNENEKANCQIIYHSLIPLLIGEQSQKQWQEFTGTLLATESKIANQLCIDLLNKIERSGILSEWINHAFVPCATRIEDAVGILQALLEEWRKLSQTLVMNDIKRLLANLNYWKDNPTIWQDPLTFDALWMAFRNGPVKDFQKTIHHLLSKNDFSDLEKVLLCSVIAEGVETFDLVIKGMRGLPFDNLNQKTSHFATMLIPYFDAMIQFIESIPPDTFAQWASSALAYNQDLSLSSYKSGIINLMKNSFDRCSKKLGAEQLEPSELFNVQASCINSGTFFNLEFSEDIVTLEDLFTLIHQNILASLECHRPKLDPARLPQEARHILEILGNIDDSAKYPPNNIKLQTHLIGESVQYPLLISTYNLPIKNHSSKLRIEYNLKSKRAEVSFEIYGHNLHQRMTLIGAKMIIATAMEGVQLLEFPFYDETAQTLKIKWVVGNDPNQLKRLIIQGAKDTLIGNFGNISIFDHKKLHELDPKFWQNMNANPGSFRHVFNGPAQDEIIMIASYFLSDLCSVPTSIRTCLLAEIGISFDDAKQGENIGNSLFRGFCRHLLEDKESISMEQSGLMKIPINSVKRLLIKLLEHLLDTNKNLVKKFLYAIGRNYGILLPKEGTFPTDEDHFFVVLTELFTRCCIEMGDLDNIQACAQFMSKHSQNGCLASMLSMVEIMRGYKGTDPKKMDEIIVLLKELLK